jgi:aspartate racemase
MNIVHILSSRLRRQPGFMNSSRQQEQRIAGVLGGMGPAATVDFLAKLVAATEAASDQDHIHLIIDHNPKVPNRHAAIAGLTPDISPELTAMAKRLEAAGADFLVMVCNTAHAYTEQIRASVSIPFVSIIDVVMDELRGLPVKHIGIMAAEGCLRAELYQKALAGAGLEAVLWSEGELARFMDLVYRIKAGDRGGDIGAGLSRLAADLVFRGAEVLVAACTEVPLFLGERYTAVPIISSTDLLVRRTITLANNRPTDEPTP